MADRTDKPSSTAANIPVAKAGGKLKRVLPGWLKRFKSGKPSGSQPNLARASVSSASGTHHPDPENDTENAELTASGGNSTDLLGPAVGRGQDGETSRTSTSANPQTQIQDRKATMKEGLGVASRFAQTLLKKVPDCLDSNPVKMAFSIAKVIIEIKDAVEDNKDELAQRLEETANRILAVETTIISGVPKAAKEAMEKLRQTLGVEMEKLQDLSSKWLATQILDHEDYQKRIQQIFQRVEGATTSFQVEMTISIQNEMSRLQDDSKKAALKSLRPSDKADHKTRLEEQALKREACTPGTRIKILEDITKWANDSSSESARVFWLTGQAGSGKTTIAYTIAKIFEEESHVDQQTILGANFLCSRQFEETRQRTRIVPTLAYQLARKFKPYADALHAADKFDAVNHDISTQLKDLLFDPWQQQDASGDQALPSYLIIIDALDEIEGDGGSVFLEELLAAINEYDLQGFKFLVTSRSHPKIVTLCESFASKAILRLQDVPIEEAESDIGMYLKIKLPQLASSPELAELERRTGGLFIYAATAVKHLTLPGSITGREQAKMLSKLLSNSSKSATASKATFSIDELYRQIMHDTFSKYDDEEILTRRLQILYTFLCTAERTSSSVVAALLAEGNDDDTITTVRAVVDDLHAVLYTQDDRVFWYHASFPDFIFNPARSNFRLGEDHFQFSCNEPAHHSLLGESCFYAMFGLRFNIGDIESSFMFDNDNVDVLSEKVNKNISAVLRYSSRHWSYHLPSPQLIDTDNLRRCISDFLEIRVLFWIEAMNLLGLSDQCTPMLQRARQWVLKCGVSYMKLASDVGEAANFATYFTGSPAAKATPHLYISALATWSHGTCLCRNWKQQFTRAPVFTHTKGSIDLPLMTVLDKNPIRAIAFSSDGMRIVSGSSDQYVRVWDASTGAELKALNGHTNWVNSVAFSSDGTRIVSGSDDQSVRVWDAWTGAELKVLNGHTNWVNSVAFSNDGTRIVSGSDDQSVRVWDASTGAELKVLDSHTDWVNSVAFSSDGTRIVSGSHDQSVRVWDASTGAELKVFNGHTDSVNSVAFSSDGTRIVSGSHDQSLRVWDASTGAELKVLNGHTSSVNSAAFSSDGTRIVSGSEDQSLRVWDASTGAELKVLNGHTSSVKSAAFSSDGTRIVSGSHDSSVRVWDASTGAKLKVLNGHTTWVNSVAFSSDGTRIVSGSHDSSVRVWDVWTGAELKVLNGHTDSVNSVAFSSDGTRIVSGSDDQSLRVWDVSTGVELKVLNGHTDWVNSVAFSSDGTRIVSGSDDQSVRVWDAWTGAKLKVLNGHTSSVNSVAFSSDGTRIVSGSHDQSLRVWDASTGAELKVLNGHTDCVNSVAFSSDGTRIVSGSHDQSVRVWDVWTGAELKLLNGHTNSVNSVAFSSDGTRIVSCSWDNSVRVWDASTGAELKELNGHIGSVNSVAFSSDGTRVVSGSVDQSIRVWTLSAFTEVNTTEDHTNSVNLVTPLSVDHFGWTLSETNWIISSPEQNHLMWVPPQAQVAQPSNILIISRHGFSSVDFRQSPLGVNWAGCYTP